MAGKVDIPKFKDYRNKVKRHPSKKFPVLSLKGKTTIAIHHSLTKRSLSGSNAEGYAKFHVDTHGWPSIGYSYVIEPNGAVKWCNDIELRTYHVGNHNNYAVGICLTGDFRTEEPTKEQKESLRNLVSALQKKYAHLKYVKGHNEFSGYEWKACPEFDYKAVLNEKGGGSGKVEAPKQKVGSETGSVVDYMNAKKMDASFKNRAKLAKKYGISGYKGTASQNTELLAYLRGDKKKPTTSKSLPNTVYRANRPYPKGSGVKSVQEALASVYFYPNKGAKNNGVDSVYGPKTADAVRRFQSMHGLSQDGVYGPKTRAKLLAVMK